MKEIASATKYLEERTIAHRDIKPDNIMYSTDSGKATLLDLGIIRPINSVASPTDDDTERPFIGTLQYSPPEFLLRVEEDSLHGWRAVTFYQLGAVLHDLIERRQIFSDQTSPYALLVNAIQFNPPSFNAADVPQDLILLAQNCLLKNWQTRLGVVDWGKFDSQSPSESIGEAAKRRLLAQHSETSFHYHDWQDDWEAEQRFAELLTRLHLIIRQWFVDQEFIPSVEIHAETGSDQGVAALLILLRSELTPRLQNNLNIRLELMLLDIRELVIELRFGASISAEIDPLESTHFPAIYSGILNENELLKAWENSFLPIYELAILQQTTIDPKELGVTSGQDENK